LVISSRCVETVIAGIGGNVTGFGREVAGIFPGVRWPSLPAANPIPSNASAATVAKEKCRPVMAVSSASWLREGGPLSVKTHI
jgi:hypothetical protein